MNVPLMETKMKLNPALKWLLGRLVATCVVLLFILYFLTGGR